MLGIYVAGLYTISTRVEDPSGRGIGDSEGFLNSTQYGFHKLKEQCFENC